jgi:hypothetical protein
LRFWYFIRRSGLPQGFRAKIEICFLKGIENFFYRFKKQKADETACSTCFLLLDRSPLYWKLSKLSQTLTALALKMLGSS